MPADLKQTINDLMPRLTDELKKLVRLPSVAFPDFPSRAGRADGRRGRAAPDRRRPARTCA